MKIHLELEWDDEQIPGAEEDLQRIALECVKAEGIEVPVYAQLRMTDDQSIQEINREINTTGSKASDIEIAKIVVELKGETEKLREQIQNIE